MPLTNDQVIAAVKAAYKAVDDNYQEAYAACTTDAQRANLRNAFVGVDTAYWAAINAIFQVNDGLLQNLVADIRTTTRQLDTEMQRLTDIVKTIQLATAVAKTALAIVALVAP